MPTPVNPATSAASIAPRPPGVGAAAAISDAPRYTAPTWAKLTPPSNAATAHASAVMYARVTPTEPPNSADSFAGERASVTTLRSDWRRDGTTWVRTRRRPRRVARAAPAMASTTAMTTSSVLLAGMENAVDPLRPAQAKNTTSNPTWTTPPASTLRPTPVTDSVGG